MIITWDALIVVLNDVVCMQRSVGATAMNEQSSRSHMVFMLYIDGKNEQTGQDCHGKSWH